MSMLARSIGVGALVLVAALAAVSSQAEEAEKKKPAVEKTVAVGTAAPDFTLPDPDGIDHTLSTLRGEKNLVLVFFRGAW